MKMVWHIMKKDLRAVWPLWLAWFGLFALRIVLLLYLLHVAGEKSLRMVSSLGGLSIIADVVIVFSLVGKMVHEDPLVGDRAFWVTRPVKGSQLLVAKVLSALLVCVVSPLVLLLPTWIGFGLDVGNIGWVLRYHSVLNGVLVVTALLFAAVTRNGGTFFLTAIVAGVSAGLIATGVESGLQTRLFRPRIIYWSLVYCGLVTALVAISVAYLKRTTRFPWGVLAGAVLLTGCLLPASSGKFRRFYSMKAVEIPQILDVKWRDGSLRLVETPARHVVGLIDVVSANASDQLQLDYRDGIWTDARGQISSAHSEGTAQFSLVNPERISHGPDKSVFSFRVIVTAPPTEWTGPLAFNGQIWVEQKKDVEVASALLAAGKTVRQENLSVRLVEVDTYEKGVRISVVEIGASDGFGRRLGLVAPAEDRCEWQMLESYSQGTMLLWLELRFRRYIHGVQGVRGYERETLGAGTDSDLAAKGWRVRWSQTLTVGTTMRELKADQLVIGKE